MSELGYAGFGWKVTFFDCNARFSVAALDMRLRRDFAVKVKG